MINRRKCFQFTLGIIGVLIGKSLSSKIKTHPDIPKEFKYENSCHIGNDIWDIYSKKTFKSEQIILDDFLDPYVACDPVVVLDKIRFRQSDGNIFRYSVIEKDQHVLVVKLWPFGTGGDLTKKILKT